MFNVVECHWETLDKARIYDIQDTGASTSGFPRGSPSASAPHLILLLGRPRFARGEESGLGPRTVALLLLFLDATRPPSRTRLPPLADENDVVDHQGVNRAPELIRSTICNQQQQRPFVPTVAAHVGCGTLEHKVHKTAQQSDLVLQVPTGTAKRTNPHEL